VFIADLGNGRCAYSFLPGNGAAQTGGDCTNPINLFGGAICQTYQGSLSMFIQNADSLGAGAYVPPDFNRWLTNVGLAAVSTAGVHRCASCAGISCQMPSCSELHRPCHAHCICLPAGLFGTPFCGYCRQTCDCCTVVLWRYLRSSILFHGLVIK
jgi:hypothetical protein